MTKLVAITSRSRSRLLGLLGGLVATCALAAVVAVPASARCQATWQPDMSGETGGYLALICDGTVPGPSDAAPRPRPPRARRAPVPTRAQYRALRYRPSAAISAQVRAELIERLAVGEHADAIRAQIDSGDLVRQAHAGLPRWGWSTRDLGDAYAQAYAERLDSWTTVIAGSYNEYERRGDAAGLARWRERARELAAGSYLLGEDLGDMRLTRRGVEPR
ncbi:hypothetical protein [Conexibacter woesei]|uniref:Uncharacterized protein n=1 Tax=Conexibacter woesei (strain DSM 14684 / CCUG 47730 / CIP 108061 / JCM 11494 / NBRC 100937 / ID131577) TaxID=469383 RepID=D3FC09_CONWI|nr:hypothetical protein [Conexibacter woesei]ADB51424.1 hypothetical protein Cwoe_3005 [Conexibacter woesei DSM 14684]